MIPKEEPLLHYSEWLALTDNTIFYRDASFNTAMIAPLSTLGVFMIGVLNYLPVFVV